MILDAHHHFWRFTEEEFGWIGDDMAAIRRDFLPGDLEPELAAAGVDGVITVQARPTLEETDWLLSLRREHGFMKGVVGWLPLADPGIDGLLERRAADPGLVGVREVVQAMPDGFLDDPAFNRGVSRLKDHGLVYDLLVVERQLPAAIRFADRHPDQPMVLDHIAKPLIKEGVMEPWAGRIRHLAERPHLTCKLSGLVTEADLLNWKTHELLPYLEVVLEAFGPDRLMLGTDWPVCRAADCGYRQWVDQIRAFVAPLSAPEQAAILGGNAARIYGLLHRTAGR